MLGEERGWEGEGWGGGERGADEVVGEAGGEGAGG